MLSATARCTTDRCAVITWLVIASAFGLVLCGGCPSDEHTDLPGTPSSGGGASSNTGDPLTPSVLSRTVATLENEPVTVQLKVDGLASLNWQCSVVSPPIYGSISAFDCLDQNTATVTYTPPKDFVGQAQFSYRVSRGAVASDVATVTVTVHPEVCFDVQVTAEQPQFAVRAFAMTKAGVPLPEGRYTWQFDDFQDSGPVATHGTRDHVFSGTGPHVIKLTLNLAELDEAVSCSTGRAGTAKELRLGLGGVLEVTPGTSFVVTGPDGGPFTPSTKIYELSNTGDEPINWAVSKTQEWVSLSSENGRLRAGDSVDVVVSINGEADALEQGSYTDTVLFMNTTNGVRDTTRKITLVVKHVLTPIARWDTVPYQRIDAGKTLNVGVVAFSGAGIQKVSFAIEGQGYSGPSPLNATQMTLNPQSGVWEYWVPISANDFGSDGPIVVEATVYGMDGGVRDKNTRGGKQGLDALRLNVNPHGTLPKTVVYVAVDGDDENGDGTSAQPFATVARAVSVIAIRQGGDCGGGIIYLLPGTHTCTNGGYFGDHAAANEYLLVTAAPGHGPNDTILVSGTARKVRKIHFQDLTMQRTTVDYCVWDLGAPGCYDCDIWVDGCRLIGRGRENTEDEHPLYLVYKNLYCTDTSITEVATAFYGGGMYKMYNMICRNVTITQISDDAFRNVPLVINCSADDIDPLNTEAHADAWQYWGGNSENHWDDNVIIYNYRASGCHFQGIIIRGDLDRAPSHAQGMALVNVCITGEEYWWNVWFRWVDHLLLWNCTFDKRFAFRSDDYAGYGNNVPPDIKDFYCNGVCFKSLQVLGDDDRNVDFSRWSENHFGEVEGAWVVRGTNTTSGDALLDEGNRPLANSPLRNRLARPLVPVDIVGVPRNSPACIGAYEY